MATFPPSNRHTGLLRDISIFSELAFVTFPRIGAVPILIRKLSPVFIGTIFSSFPEPTAESNRLIFNFAMSEFSGSESGFPITDPKNESPRVRDGSSFVPIATNPPGFTESTIPAPVPNETISVLIGS